MRSATIIVSSASNARSANPASTPKFHHATPQKWPNWKNIRTPQEEERIQTYNPEQFALDSTKRIFHAQVLHANDMAVRVLGLLEAKRVNYKCGLKDHRGQAGCICSLIDVMELLCDENQLYTILEKYGVASDLWNYSMKMIRAVAKVRYANIE